MGCDVWGSRQKVQLRSKARHREGSVGNREAGGRAGARPTGVRSGERGPWNAGGTSQQSRENSPEPKLCVSRSEALPPAASRRLPARGPREGPTEARGSGNGSRVPGSAGSQRAVPGSRSPSPQAHEQGRAVGGATSPSLTTASRGWRPHLASEETASAARVGHGEPQRAGPRPWEDQRTEATDTRPSGTDTGCRATERHGPLGTPPGHGQPAGHERRAPLLSLLRRNERIHNSQPCPFTRLQDETTLDVQVRQSASGLIGPEILAQTRHVDSPALWSPWLGRGVGGNPRALRGLHGVPVPPRPRARVCGQSSTPSRCCTREVT